MLYRTRINEIPLLLFSKFNPLIKGYMTINIKLNEPIKPISISAVKNDEW